MAYDFMSLLSDTTLSSIKNSFEVEMISVYKLVPASDKKNFYHADADEVLQVARSIELVGGIKQNLVVKPIPDTDTYEVIAGHKRRLATLLLLKEGKTQYEYVPCMIEREESEKDAVLNELSLIFTNSTQRDETDAETMHAVVRAKELLEEYDRSYGITGDKDKIIAELLGTSRSKVGRLKSIHNNLIPEFMKEFEYGSINVSVANEIAGIKDSREQVDLYRKYMDNGQLTIQDVVEAKERQQLKGQMDMEDYPECLPDNKKPENTSLPQIGEEKPEKESEEPAEISAEISTENDPEEISEQYEEEESEKEAEKTEPAEEKTSIESSFESIQIKENTNDENNIQDYEKMQWAEKMYDNAKRYRNMIKLNTRRDLFVKYTTMMEAFDLYMQYLTVKAEKKKEAAEEGEVMQCEQ